MKQRLENRHEGVGNDLRALFGRMDAVGLKDAGVALEALVEHGHESDMMPGCEVAIDLGELLDVVGPVVGRKRNAGEQDFDVGLLERSKYGIEIAPHLRDRLTAQAVVTAEFDDDDRGVKHQDGRKRGNSVFAGGAAGAAIHNSVRVAEVIEPLLQRDGIGLVCRETVARGDAVSEADEQGPACGEDRSDGQEEEKCSEKASANVHECSVRRLSDAKRWRLAR